ncbi:MAG: divalent-cation tolerance protein CutA [Spirulinaceae cyanobacterium]
MLNAEGYGLVLVTASSQEEADAIATSLVANKLAACVSIAPIRSLYIWQGEVHNEQEWQLTIKTHLRKFKEIEEQVRTIHSYEVPEIIAIPIVAGSQPYLNWLAEQTESN